ncbi:hypothetical protein HNO89_002966 [Sporosarcina luteola]|nr:hypothetical protein [Sporosarcina luteola]
MKFHQLFIAALKDPKKLAAFRLLPIGKVIQYIFLFIAIYTIVSFTRFVLGDASLFDASPELLEYSKTIGWLIYPIALVLQFVIATFYIFVRISLFGLAGVLFAMIMKRKAEYRHLWRTTAVSVTVPLLITLVLDSFPAFRPTGIYLSSIVHVLYIAAAVKYYPKLRK